jgi:hypothetical protein
MTSNDNPIGSSDNETVAFCATCGHSELLHGDDVDRQCLLSTCACNRFIVGPTPDPSAQVLP